MSTKYGGALKIPALFAATFLIFSCASTPKKTSGSEFVPDPEAVTSIPLPETRERSYFSSVNQEALSLAENGSPETLRQTASILHKTLADEYSEQEKVLLYTCAQIMSIVWPEENVTWEVPEADGANPYIGALNSARRGIYDSSTGYTDFLTRVLPSLVLLSSSSRTDYYQESYDALNSALKLKPDSVLANYLMGVLLLRQNKPEQSLICFNRALSGSRNNFEILSAVARAQLVAGHYDAAIVQAEALLESHQQDTDLLKICSEAYYNEGKLEEAENYVLRVLQLQPENLDYVLFRARILIDKGDYIRASSLLDVYSRSDQSSRNYLLLRARMQRDWNKNLTAAADTISRAVSLYPEDVEVLLFAADIASSSSQSVAGHSALELSQMVLGYEPENEKALVICIDEMIRLNEMETAYSLSTMLVNKSGASDQVKRNHASLCLSLDYRDEAWKIAQELYASNPSDEDNLQTYIKVLAGTGRKTQAQELIARLMPDAGSRMKSFLYYEKSFFESDDEDVLSDLRSSLTANPRNRDSLFRLYQIYYNRRDWKRAQYYLKQVVALEPANASILNLNSELEALLGR